MGSTVTGLRYTAHYQLYILTHTTDFMGNGLFFRRLQCLLIIGMFTPLLSNAQSVPVNTSKAASAASAASGKGTVMRPTVTGKPLWNELTPMQQQALQPLSGSWGTISEAQKRKWLAVSKNYPALPPDEQATMHSRMNEWVSLSSLQRAEARLNFATTKELSRQLTPEEKLAKWQTYQSLSVDEKQKLAEKANTKPVGAALATRPVAPQKLAPVQPHPSASSVRAAQGGTPKTAANAPARAASAR